MGFHYCLLIESPWNVAKKTSAVVVNNTARLALCWNDKPTQQNHSSGHKNVYSDIPSNIGTSLYMLIFRAIWTSVFYKSGLVFTAPSVKNLVKAQLYMSSGGWAAFRPAVSFPVRNSKRSTPWTMMSHVSSIFQILPLSLMPLAL